VNLGQKYILVRGAIHDGHDWDDYSTGGKGV
jgi:hypothetical protein